MLSCTQLISPKKRGLQADSRQQPRISNVSLPLLIFIFYFFLSAMGMKKPHRFGGNVAVGNYFQIFWA
jgi:hypothetical protein